MPYKDPAVARERHRIYMQTWTKANRVKHQAAVAVSKKVRVAENARRLRELKSLPCTDCGRKFEPEGMDFDHVRGVKAGSVTLMVHQGCGWDTIMAEVAKCELVCAVCHRIRTRQRRQLACS